MTSAAFARIDVSLLYPSFLARMETVLERLGALGVTFIATEGLRTMTRSAVLYLQGRTTPGKIVTDAEPGYSAHNYGLALDFGRFYGKRYSDNPADYEILGVEAERAGLIWGGRWKRPDAPHIQWPGFVSSAQLQPLKDIYDARTIVRGTNWLSDVWTHVTATSDTQPNIPVPADPKEEPTT